MPPSILRGILFAWTLLLASVSLQAQPPKQNDTIVFLGDSITAQGVRPGGYVQQIAKTIADAYPQQNMQLGKRKVTAEDFKAATFEGMPYRLFVPEQYDARKRYPLVLFLHGAGERGNDNLRQLTGQTVSMTFAQPDCQSKHPCFVLVPQCPNSDQWVRAPFKPGIYALTETPTSDALTTVLHLLSELEKQYSLDKDRLYVTGLSMGGYGTWDLICRYPNRFAAAIPVCGGVDPSQAQRIARVPLRFYHGDADTAVLPDGDRAMSRALAEIDTVDAVYKEYQTGHGGCWMMAYAETGLADWLFRQVRRDAAER